VTPGNHQKSARFTPGFEEKWEFLPKRLNGNSYEKGPDFLLVSG
jgi:hypothetical protein